MNAYLKLLVVELLTCATIALATVGLLSSYNNRVLPVTEDSVLELKSGQPFSNFAAELAQAGLIEHPTLWSWQARLSGDARKIQAGEYWLRVGDTPQLLLDRLLRGEVVYYEVKLLEGWTVQQVLEELAAHSTLVQELIGADVHTLLGALGMRKSVV